MEKTIVTFSMIVIGLLVVLAETDWPRQARDYIRGKLTA